MHAVSHSDSPWVAERCAPFVSVPARPGITGSRQGICRVKRGGVLALLLLGKGFKQKKGMAAAIDVISTVFTILSWPFHRGVFVVSSPFSLAPLPESKPHKVSL